MVWSEVDGDGVEGMRERNGWNLYGWVWRESTLERSLETQFYLVIVTIVKGNSTKLEIEGNMKIKSSNIGISQSERNGNSVDPVTLRYCTVLICTQCLTYSQHFHFQRKLFAWFSC